MPKFFKITSSRPSPWSMRAKPISEEPFALVAGTQDRHALRLWIYNLLGFAMIMLFILFLLMFLVILIFTFLIKSSDILGVSLLVFIGAVTALQVGRWLIIFLWRRSLRSKILQTRGQMCPMCEYDLTSRPRDENQCPECGMVASRRQCVRIWCQFLRSGF